MSGSLDQGATAFGRWLILQAARGLPDDERVDSEVEWLAHLEDTPAWRTRLLHAVGVWRSVKFSRQGAERWMASPQTLDIFFYVTWMVTTGEVELDVLAGRAASGLGLKLVAIALLSPIAARFIFATPNETKK